MQLNLSFALIMCLRFFNFTAGSLLCFHLRQHLKKIQIKTNLKIPKFVIFEIIKEIF